MTPKSTLSRRRKSSKKKVEPASSSASSDYHRGMSKEVIAKYLADMERDDFEFDPGTVKEKVAVAETRNEVVVQETPAVEPIETTRSEVAGGSSSWALEVEEEMEQREKLLLAETMVDRPTPAATTSYASVAATTTKSSAEDEKPEPKRSAVSETPALVVEVIDPKKHKKQKPATPTADNDGFTAVLSSREKVDLRRTKSSEVDDDNVDSISEIIDVDIDRNAVGKFE